MKPPGPYGAGDERQVYLLACFIRRCTGYVVELDDLCQEGMIGLLQAREHYRPNRDCTFATYARHRVYGAMRDYLRAMDPLTRGQRRAENLRRQADVALTAAPPYEEEQQRASEWDAPELPYTGRRLDQAFARLTVKERIVLRAEFWQGATQEATARELGVTAGRVSQVRKAALGKLRKRLERP